MTMTPSDTAVARLLEQYGQYKQLLAQQTKVARLLAKAKLSGALSETLETEYNQYSTQLQQLSDDMTFDSPSIWMCYKFEAYKDEPQPIRTMHDFRQHCSKPGYICTRRFEFVTQELSAHGLDSFNDHVRYPGDMLLDQVWPDVHTLESEVKFMDMWRHHEYYTIDGHAAKWRDL